MKEFVHYFSLVDLLASMSLKSEASKLYLSYFWWVLEPAMFVGVFYLVFEYILNRGQADFVFFLICGKVPFLWFSKSVLNSAESLIKNKGIIAALRMPKIIYPYVAVQETLYKQWVAFLIVLSTAMYFERQPALDWMWLGLPILTTYVFILAVSMMAALVVTVVQDLRIVVSMGVLFLMFSSGVFWDVNSIANAETKELVLLLNPLAFLLDSYRQVLMYNNLFDVHHMLCILVFSLSWVAVGHWLFKRGDRFLATHVMQS